MAEEYVDLACLMWSGKAGPTEAGCFACSQSKPNLYIGPGDGEGDSQVLTPAALMPSSLVSPPSSLQILPQTL